MHGECVSERKWVWEMREGWKGGEETSMVLDSMHARNDGKELKMGIGERNEDLKGDGCVGVWRMRGWRWPCA